MILCQGGYVGFAEIKTTGKKPTKIQTYIHEKLRALGFKVFVIDDLESRDAAITFFLNKVKEITNVSQNHYHCSINLKTENHERRN